LFFLTILAILRFTMFKEPPTLADLRREFPKKRANLETILRMSNEDLNFYRIAPDFLDRTLDNAKDSGRYMKGDPAAGLTQSRWDAYRKLYTHSGVKLGVQRDFSGDAFIMIDSVGILNRGHASGYLYCAPTSSVDSDRFQPCLLQADKGSGEYDPATGDEGYSFEKLEDRWYVYDLGPS
jgi:hypothetical protein